MDDCKLSEIATHKCATVIIVNSRLEHLTVVLNAEIL